MLSTILYSAAKRDMHSTPKKIVIITTGQPSTNPRMMKEFRALLEQGFNVSVLYSFWASWAHETDKPLIAGCPGRFTAVGGDPYSRKSIYFFSRLLYKFFSFCSGKLGLFADYSQARASFFLKRAAVAQKADLYIAHNLGALPAAVHAAKKYGVKAGFDAEDYHRGESVENSINARRAAYMEDKYFCRLDYLTTSAPLIAAAYRKLYPVLGDIPVVLNTFSVEHRPAFSKIEGGSLRIIWFSQSIGLNRGLQDIFNALNRVTEVPVAFTLIGQGSEPVKDQLRGLLSNDMHHVSFLEPLTELALLEACGKCHIGLALEPGFSENNKMALSNKIFSYLLTGNYVIASNTPAQELFFSTNKSLGEIYPIGDTKALAGIITRWGLALDELEIVRRNIYEHAEQEYSWEQERNTFLSVVEKTLLR